MESNDGAAGQAPHSVQNLTDYAMSFMTADHTGQSRIALQTAKIYGFTIGQFRFLLDDGLLAELITRPSCTPLPNAPGHCLGLANIRGNIVPCYGIQRLLFPGDEKQQSSEYGLMIGEGSAAVMLSIDSKPTGVDKKDLIDKHFVPSIPAKLHPFVRTVYAAQGEDWHLIDCYALFKHLATLDDDM